MDNMESQLMSPNCIDLFGDKVDAIIANAPGVADANQ